MTLLEFPPVDIAVGQEVSSISGHMFRIIVLHKPMSTSLRESGVKVRHKCFTNNFHIQLFVHDTLEDADGCRTMHADSSPHVHFCWMFGPSWIKEKI